jgi:chromate reductase, NAD(P)H dehydrogenase (quinone)
MITLISGTNRVDSYTRKVVSIYQSLLQQHEQPSAIIDLVDLPKEFIFSDLYGSRSASVKEMEQQLLASSCFVFILPEYNGSFPGILKTFIDAFHPPKFFHGRKAALVGLSSGKFGNLRGLEHLSGVLNYVQIQLLPFRAHIPKVEAAFNADQSDIIEPSIAAELQKHVQKVIQFTNSSILTA